MSFKRPPADFDALAGVLDDLSRQVAIAADNMWAHASLQELNRRLQEQNRFLKSEMQGEWSKQENFEFISPAMKHVMERVHLVSGTDASVLLTGETGTGKGALARHIHDLSPCRDNLFVTVNCPAIVPELFESEIFGHSRGAFTGAHAQRIGRLEMARDGTLFLDEITELPVGLQAKLLHVLQDHAFERVGESHPIEARFRVISATNQDLPSAIERGRFRRDLYYRLSTVTVDLPPLRDRREDIPILIERVAAAEEVATQRPAPVFTAAAAEALCRYDWPGNIRELKNFVRRLFVLRAGEEHLPRRGQAVPGRGHRTASGEPGLARGIRTPDHRAGAARLWRGRGRTPGRRPPSGAGDLHAPVPTEKARHRPGPLPLVGLNPILGYTKPKNRFIGRAGAVGPRANSLGSHSKPAPGRMAWILDGLWTIAASEVIK